MSSSKAPDSGGDHITVGKIENDHGAIAIGRGARAVNTPVGGGGTPVGPLPEPKEPWWRRLSLARLGVGLVLAIVAFVVSLWIYPAEWGESWRTVVALAVAAARGSHARSGCHLERLRKLGRSPLSHPGHARGRRCCVGLRDRGRRPLRGAFERIASSRRFQPHPP